VLQQLSKQMKLPAVQAGAACTGVAVSSNSTPLQQQGLWRQCLVLVCTVLPVLSQGLAMVYALVRLLAVTASELQQWLRGSIGGCLFASIG
jgi:hypothetical protein